MFGRFIKDPMRRLRDRSYVAAFAAAMLVTAGVTPGAAQDWKKDWDQLVVAAKKEGTVVVSGPIGNAWQEALTKGFEKEFGIKVEYTANWGRDFYPRLAQERKVGKYLWDVRTVAAGIESYEMLPDGTFDSVRDMLIRPDVKDDENWHGGLTDGFADKQKKYFFGFGLNSLPVAWVNRDFIPESQLKNVRDILKPEFKGKITIQDLRTGAAVVGLGVVMGAEGFGPDFIRKVVKDQGAPIIKNSRQQVEWLVRGSHPIGLVITSDILTQFQSEGLGKNVVPLEEGLLTSSSGFGGLIAINKPPHPNAAKLYSNWVLTKDAQQQIADIVGYNSRRKDVKPGSPVTVVDPSRLNEYIYSQKEELLPYYGQVIELARELDK